MKITLVIFLTFITALLTSSGFAASIEGILLMLDGKTPHVAVVVQAVLPSADGASEPEVVATALSDESGKYQLINLKPGDYQVRCYTGEYIYFGQQAPTMTGTILQVEHMINSTFDQTFLKFEGKTLNNIDFRFPPFKKGGWRHYTRLDGLVHNTVNRIYVDSEGSMWLGTDGGGISRFDGNQFLNFTHEDGLPPYPCIWAIHQDADGMMWFGLWQNGVYCGVYPFDKLRPALERSEAAGFEGSRRDGKQFAKFAKEEEGLAHANVLAIQRDTDGALWFGTWGRGVYRYDGKNLLNFTQQDGLQNNTILPFHCAPDGMMWFWTPPGWFSRYDGKEFTNFTEKDALVNNYEAFVNLKSHHNLLIHRAPKGGLWLGRSLWGWRDGVVGYNGKKFVNFTTADGLPHNRVESIQSTSDGVVWFGMWGGGISSYDGRGLINFTTEDGLLSNIVKHLYIDTDGVIWVATGSAILGFERGGLSRYDPRGFVNFTTRDGLPSNAISTLQRSSDGALWIGTCGGGISRYDGKKFVNFTTKDGLVGNYVTTMALDADGIFWFGTGAMFVPGNGVSRYDTRTGKFLPSLTTKEGLASNTILFIFTAADGVVWFGTKAGISRYDTRTGKFLPSLTTKEGLVNDNVYAIYCDPDGMMWFDSHRAGVTRYDGNQFTNFEHQEGMIRMTRVFHRDEDKVIWSGLFGLGVGRYDGNQFVHITQKDGLADNLIRVIYPNTNGVCVAASDEMIWLGTDSKGVLLYDGVAWSSLDTQDGLAGNSVTSIVQDADGSFWFGTQDGGLTHYRRTSSRPKTHIVSVTTDKTYRSLDDIPPPITGTRVTIEYNAIDFKTIPEKRQYRYRLREIDEDWLRPTIETSFDYSLLEPGEYTFEVQAIDRDLNYSLPASVTFTVVPPFYLRASFFVPTIGGGTILLALSIILATIFVRHRRRIRAYERAAVKELQDAQRMQMSLMPESAPPIEGIEIAGKCLPANTVSGDFFDYLEGKQPNEVALVVADVCGKAMKGAMNAVMADGVLRMAVKKVEQLSPGSLMSDLNNVLKDRMEWGMNITMVIGTIDAETKTLTLANAAHHAYPLLLRNGEVETLKTGGMPLGMMAGIQYTQQQFSLESGDVIILMTDGIIEAQNSEKQLYSDSGRLEKIISQFTLNQSAEAMVETILNDARSFGGDKTQRDDDMTVVIARVL